MSQCVIPGDSTVSSRYGFKVPTNPKSWPQRAHRPGQSIVCCNYRRKLKRGQRLQPLPIQLYRLPKPAVNKWTRVRRQTSVACPNAGHNRHKATLRSEILAAADLPTARRHLGCLVPRRRWFRASIPDSHVPNPFTHLSLAALVNCHGLVSGCSLAESARHPGGYVLSDALAPRLSLTQH